MGNFLKQYSLQLAGILNLIGDVGFLGTGIKTRDPYKISGGGLYTLGGLNLALFGKVKPEENLRRVKEEVAALIDEKTGHAAARPEGGDALYRHAADNTLTAYTAGAAAMLASGIKKHNAGLGSAGLYYGASSLAFKLGSRLIPEQAAGGAGEKSGGIVGWIREKPLRLFGYGSVVTDSFLALDTWHDYKHNPNKSGYGWSAVTAGTYILADLLMAISSKDPANAGGKFPEGDRRDIEAGAAEKIARQPKESREALIAQAAEFLAARPEMGGDATAIGQAIREHMEQAAPASWTARTAPSSAPPVRQA